MNETNAVRHNFTKLLPKKFLFLKINFEILKKALKTVPNVQLAMIYISNIVFIRRLKMAIESNGEVVEINYLLEIKRLLKNVVTAFLGDSLKLYQLWDPSVFLGFLLTTVS